MPRATWLLLGGSPVIQATLIEPFTGFSLPRVLLADTGAAPRVSPFEIVLNKLDGDRFGRAQFGTAAVNGAIRGEFPVRGVEISISTLGVRTQVRALCVPGLTLPNGASGIAAFRFLNFFSYGNFGDPNIFGLEALPA